MAFKKETEYEKRRQEFATQLKNAAIDVSIGIQNTFSKFYSKRESLSIYQDIDKDINALCDYLFEEFNKCEYF